MDFLRKLGNNFAKLIDVKSILTLVVAGTLAYLAIAQNVEVPSELFASVITAVFTYFFTKKADGTTITKSE